MENLKINKTIDTQISISVNEIADMFCEMDGEQQAGFFNRIGESVKSWKSPFVFQLQAIVETEMLTDVGKQIMFEIGEYSHGLTWRKQKEVDEFINQI